MIGASVASTVRGPVARTNLIANLFPVGGTYSVSDVCEPIAESHIIAYSPHMHKYGRAQKSVVTHVTLVVFQDVERLVPALAWTGAALLVAGGALLAFALARR